MFTKSATPATPVTRPKSHITDSVTWVRDWYSPLESVSGAPPNLKLKAWVKKTSAAAEEKIAISDDSLDLEKLKYLEEPVVAEEVVEEKPKEENESDLKLALSIDKKEDQISSLSGLGI